MFVYINSSQLGVILLPKGLLAVSGDILVVIIRGGSTGI